MKSTKFQKEVEDILAQGKSALVVAPTGLGKTFAVLADLGKAYTKVVYATPLRTLGFDVRDSIIRDIKRKGESLTPVVHHGDTQESSLFSEEIVVTTYDQIVCAVPGLPLSFPLKSGHAVAGALLMSRLIFDEAHLSWAISKQALSILFGILEFRKNLGLQSVFMTATLPKTIAKAISNQFEMELIFLSKYDLDNDEGLELREKNRFVVLYLLQLKLLKDKKENKNEEREVKEFEEDNADDIQEKRKSSKIDIKPLDDLLINTNGKRIYFANTVERIQETYDRLIKSVSPEKITILHNRMPRSWRLEAEKQTKERFGKESQDADWLLLTNQVAEAGLDISASLVISDPAPVDTLIQRSGRCARWFRNKKTKGSFYVIKLPNKTLQAEWGKPYNEKSVEISLKNLPNGKSLNWKSECNWLSNSWNGGEKSALEEINKRFDDTTFALNLFDRAAQDRKPGEIASIFREILSVNVAIQEGASIVSNFIDESNDLQKRLQDRLEDGYSPETCSISLRRAWNLVRKAKGGAGVIRYLDDRFQIVSADYVKPDDILIIPSSLAYLHKIKGLCFIYNKMPEDEESNSIIKSSNWFKTEDIKNRNKGNGTGYQSLIEHTQKVMKGVNNRLSKAGIYRNTMINVLKSLEPDKNADNLANIIASLATLATGFHDLGKSDRQWQQKVRQIDPKAPLDELIGRTHKDARAEKIRRPHTPPTYSATLEACRLLLGRSLGDAEYLVRAIALAAARHHSSLLNPAKVKYQYQPDERAIDFIKAIFKEVNAPEQTLNQAEKIIQAANTKLELEDIPLLFPNDDLFPIYALVGRAILISDREDAAGQQIEQWRD